MKIKKLKNKRILILGFGKEGKDNYLALRKLFPKKIIAIADQCSDIRYPNIEKSKYLKLHLGENYLKALKNYNVIIKSPGISLAKIFAAQKFGRASQKITSQTEIFFDNCPGTIVGITGTKGKGTTASLIYKILKRAGLKAHLIGNIGKPVFQLLLRSTRNDIFIYELSSHQLQNLKKSPHIAVFLNLYPDHLNYYKNFKEYQEAKENIALHQTKDDFLVYNVADKKVREIAKRITKKTKAQKLPFALNTKLTYIPRSWYICYIRGEWIFCGEEKIIKIKDIPLKGDFNILNVMAAVSVARLFNASTKSIKGAIKSFRPLPHHLEFIGKYKGIEFYNDSMATIPEVTIAALNALGGKVKTLIAGGLDKGSDYSTLAQKILESDIKTLILFPETGKKLWDWEQIKRIKKQPNKIQRSSDLVRFFTNSMREAARITYEQTRKGGICLLSPGAASFNLFRDYKERGNLFKKYVKLYAKQKVAKK